MAKKLFCDRCGDEMPNRVDVALVPTYKNDARPRIAHLPHMQFSVGRRYGLPDPEWGDIGGDLCEACGAFIKTVVEGLMRLPRVNEVEYKEVNGGRTIRDGESRSEG